MFGQTFGAGKPAVCSFCPVKNFMNFKRQKKIGKFGFFPTMFLALLHSFQ
jgi:hypothetical protein